MLKWIKEQLGYRAKYQALLKNENKAAQNALTIMGQYDHLCANLPYEHELSTKRHWEEFADHRLLNQYQAQTRDLNKLRETHRSMVQLWSENLAKYGFSMYADWQPIKYAPRQDRATILVFQWYDKDQPFYQTAAWENGKWVSASGEYLNDVTHWVHLPPPPKD